MDAVGRAEVAAGGDGGEDGFGARVGGEGGGFGPTAEHDAFSAEAEAGPEFLGDERRVGVEELEDALDRVVQRGQRAGTAWGVYGKVGFRDFDKAVAEIAPDEVVECLGDVAEFIGLVALVDAADGVFGCADFVVHKSISS